MNLEWSDLIIMVTVTCVILLLPEEAIEFIHENLFGLVMVTGIVFLLLFLYVRWRT